MFKIFVGSPLVAAVALSSCGPNAGQSTAAGADEVEQGTNVAAALISNTADDVAAAVSPTPTAQGFIDSAARSDAFEIASAKLAGAHAASAAVKAFAEEMIAAHTVSARRINAAAGSVLPAMTPDVTLTAQQERDLAELGNLKGARFDEEYVNEQVDAHEDALALMRTYAGKGDVHSLRTAAGEIALVVSHHLERARGLDAALGKPD